MNKIVEIISDSEGFLGGDLKYYFHKVFTAPNNHNPYHNFRHAMQVACRAYEAGKYCDYHNKFSKKDFRALIISALFHDFGHDGQWGNDNLNVMNAYFAAASFLLSKDQEMIREIKKFISATAIDFPKQELTLGEAIIRDADMGSIFEESWIQNVVFGLAKERGIEPFRLLEEEIVFVKKMEFHSAWGKEVLAPKIPAKIAEIESLLTLLR